tara:strand:+ start:156 stop:536 length:381 start_codon:yes stop_codon:yes gene_type:complete
MRYLLILSIALISPLSFAYGHGGGSGGGGGDTGSGDTSYGGSSGGGYGGGSSAAGGLLLLGGIYYFFIRDNGEEETDTFNSKLTNESKFEISFQGDNFINEDTNFNIQNFSFPQNTFQLNFKYKLN